MSAPTRNVDFPLQNTTAQILPSCTKRCAMSKAYPRQQKNDLDMMLCFFAAWLKHIAMIGSGKESSCKVTKLTTTSETFKTDLDASMTRRGLNRPTDQELKSQVYVLLGIISLPNRHTILLLMRQKCSSIAISFGFRTALVALLLNSLRLQDGTGWKCIRVFVAALRLLS